MHQTTTTNNKSVHLPGKGDEIVRRQVHSGFLRCVFYIDILGIFLRKFSCDEFTLAKLQQNISAKQIRRQIRCSEWRGIETDISYHSWEFTMIK